MIFEYGKVVVLNFSKIENTVFFISKFDRKLIFSWYFWTSHDILRLGKYGFSCSVVFVLNMVPFSLILRKVNARYECGKKGYKLNNLLFADDLRLFSKSEKQMDTFVRTFYVFSTDIGMEIGIKKYGTSILKRIKMWRWEDKDVKMWRWELDVKE